MGLADDSFAGLQLDHTDPQWCADDCRKSSAVGVDHAAIGTGRRRIRLSLPVLAHAERFERSLSQRDIRLRMKVFGRCSICNDRSDKLRLHISDLRGEGRYHGQSEYEECMS